MEKVEKEFEKDRKIRELESRNALLTRKLHSLKPNPTQYLSRYSLPKTAVDSTLNKRVYMNQTIKVKPTEFKKEELKLFPTVIGEGVYGKVKIGELTNFQQNVAVKEIRSKSPTLHAYVEAKVMLTLNGHKNFPLLFGWIKPNMILMEFIGIETSTSPTLKLALSFKEAQIEWLLIIKDILIAMKHMHDHGFLHNDLHPRNILIRDLKSVKIIDFGNATLIEDPVVYNVAPAKRNIYNTRHLHLAFELRNVPRSEQSVKTDIYSVGYNFGLINEEMKSLKLGLLCQDMVNDTPEKRPEIPQIIKKVELLKYQS